MNWKLTKKGASNTPQKYDTDDTSNSGGRKWKCNFSHQCVQSLSRTNENYRKLLSYN